MQQGSATSEITDAHNRLTDPHSSGQRAVNAGFDDIAHVYDGANGGSTFEDSEPGPSDLFY